MSKVIKVKLDPRSIDEAIKELQEYKAQVEKKARALVDVLGKYGVQIAKAKIIEHKIIHDTKLSNSITYARDGKNGYVRVDDEYAVFFEFGTGPVGAKHSHPSGDGKYKSEGWFTAADGKAMHELYGWKPIEAYDGELIYFTQGQPSKPFMYETAQQLRTELARIAKELFEE